MNISLAIPAYNAEKNIRSILESLLGQKTSGFDISELIVHSDQSNDNTASEVAKVADERVKLIENFHRKGFAGSLKALLDAASGDIVAVFNDDIKITDPGLLEKLVWPFLNEENVGMVCGRPFPLSPTNFVEKAIFSTYLAYDQLRNRLPNRHNKFTCDGKILVFSRAFINQVHFPADYRLMGNVDIYLYFACLVSGMNYRHVRSALVYYRNPTTVKDYVKWTSRNNANKAILEKRFGPLVEQEHKIPKHLFLYSTFKEFVKNPLGGIFIFVMRFYLKFKSHKFSKNFDTKWETVETTKKL